MDVKLPFWLLRRLAKRNPWLLSTTGAVSRSLVVGFLFWEFTIDTTLTVSPDQRERLLKERGSLGHGDSDE
jgi:hypothetical protein